MRPTTRFKTLLLAFGFVILTIFLVKSALLSKDCSGKIGQDGNDKAFSLKHKEKLNTIYVITPTYARPEQKAELTRFANTLLHVPDIHWIVVEDAEEKTKLVTNFINQIIQYAPIPDRFSISHLNVLTPLAYQNKPNDPNWLRPRGASQRNKGLKWIRENKDLIDPRGVVYFADDDNSYDIRLFEEMRTTKGVSCWPVGLVGGIMVERPLLNKEGKIIGFNSAFKPERPYPIDMAAFAVNVQLFLNNPQVHFTYKIPRGYQESYILKQLISEPSEMEPKADNCNSVLVWHTRTERANLKREARLKIPSNQGIEV